MVANLKFKRILVNSGSTVKVLSWKACRKMGLKKRLLTKASTFYSFVNHLVKVKGSITLLVILEDSEHMTTESVKFYVIDHPMAYNVIFGRLIMRMATFYMKIKFPTKIGVCFLLPD
ncbi:hypothetical protein PVK06_002130 [Gossypium arboreum]|uniref:Uncharacterized protein n=1 Tax=Gossypium arboreum TaxID=29729 RepID=A0ABR0R465_GOSAR|nr:hypothetical protein PVK06_002130 [Gossypium arboreum]